MRGGRGREEGGEREREGEGGEREGERRYIHPTKQFSKGYVCVGVCRARHVNPLRKFTKNCVRGEREGGEEKERRGGKVDTYNKRL